MNRGPRLTALLLALGAVPGLAGCLDSPPAQFIALDSTTPSGGTLDIGRPPLLLGGIELDSGLDRPYLVRRTGPNTRKIAIRHAGFHHSTNRSARPWRTI